MRSSPSSTPAAPFSHLDPAQVLDALFAAGFEPDGRLLQLNSYENRVWQAHLEDGRVVVAKFYRPGRWSDAQIAEEHAFTQELADSELPVLAPLALTPRHDGIRLLAGTASLGEVTLHPESATDGASAAPGVAVEARCRLAVYERRVGRAPDLESPESLARLGRLLGRMHAVGSRSRFACRRRLDVATFGRQPRQALLDSGRVRPETDGAWIRASAAVLEAIERQFEQIGPLRQIRLHGDCHPGNILWREEGSFAGPNLVDFDDCCTGPAVQDLWMLLPGEREVARDAIWHVLDGYRDFMDFDDREFAAIEALRCLRMLHHSAWIAARWDDPAFPVAFPWFASPAYWQQQATELHEQLEHLHDPST